MEFVPTRALRINGKRLDYGGDTGITVARSMLSAQGGGKVRQTWNGDSFSTARGAWRKFVFTLTFQDAALPPALQDMMHVGQIGTIDSPYENGLAGYTNPATTPRVAPPAVKDAVMWDVIPGSISFLGVDRRIDGDGTFALPAGVVPADVSDTFFLARHQVMVMEGLDASLEVVDVSYTGSVKLVEYAW